jgi:hypothetical protein
MAVIINTVTLDVTARTNCQVCSVPCIYLYCGLILLQLQGLGNPRLCEQSIFLYTSVLGERIVLSIIFSRPSDILSSPSLRY